MTNDQEPESFSLALREAAYDFEPPNPERFHTDAVRRTRQIKRRRSAGGALAGVVAVGVAGALAVTVSGRPSGGGVSAASGTPGHPAAAASAADSPPRPKPSGSSSSPGSSSTNADGVTQGEVLQAFYDALPNGSDVSRTQDPEAGVTAPGATTPLVNSLSGEWYVSITASLQKPGDSAFSSVEIAVTRGLPVQTCTEAEHGSSTDTCTLNHVDGGTLILDESRHNPADPTSDPIWEYYWLSPAGYEVDLSIGAGSVADFALAQQQASEILTSSVWAPIAENLPAPVCVGGNLSNAYPGVGTTSGGIGKMEARCSTDGKLYPLS